MTPLIQLKRIAPVFLVPFLLASFAVLDEAQAVQTDPEDWFPGGNTGAGQSAFLNLSVEEGLFNTAHGWLSLNALTTGDFNTAIGAGALLVNNGGNNTATGAAALLSNMTGEDNTANGVSALGRNIEGNWNTAVGSQALASNTNFDNTAVGFQALTSNTDGHSNTATGRGALAATTLGSFNVGIGRDTLGGNTTGNSNTAVGYGALFTNTTGANNVALGAFSGKGVTTAFNVICIGNGVLGADVSNSTWIGNVYGVTTQSGMTAPVVVSDGGQLGTVASSERFKKDVATMQKASEAVLSLRPVTFHYKTDAKDTPQFGLIAEEVAKVNPALVLPDKEGKPYTVRYEAVNAMLLNEFLKEHKAFLQEQRKVEQLEKQVEKLTVGLQKVSAQLELSKPVPRAVVTNK
jgi:Chaperone of endosialidase